MGDGRSGESSTPVPAKPDVGLVKPDECQGPPLGQPTRVELVTAMLKGMQPPRATQASVGAEGPPCIYNNLLFDSMCV